MSVRIAGHTPHLSVPLGHYVRAYVNSTLLLARESAVLFAEHVPDATVAEQCTTCLNQYHPDRAFVLSWTILEISNWHPTAYRSALMPHPTKDDAPYSDWITV